MSQENKQAILRAIRDDIHMLELGEGRRRKNNA